MKKLFKKGAAILGVVLLLANVILPGVVAYAEGEEEPVVETPAGENIETPAGDPAQSPEAAPSNPETPSNPAPTGDTPAPESNPTTLDALTNGTTNEGETGNDGNGDTSLAPAAAPETQGETPVNPETPALAKTTANPEIQSEEGQPEISKASSSDDLTISSDENTCTDGKVACIGTTGYDSLENAFAGANDGDTITLLSDCAGNGIKALQGAFNTNGLTVDFAGHTYTVDGETVGSDGTETNGFQLLKENKITFKNGTITSSKAKILIQNYSNLTLDKMTLTLDNPDYAYAYTLSNNNGEIIINDSTINANPAGLFAFDVCRYSSYQSVHVTVKGDSVINGNVEISASKKDPKDGFSLKLESGTLNGDIILDQSVESLVGTPSNNVSIEKSAGFNQTAPEGYVRAKLNDTTYSLVAIGVNVAEIDGILYESLQTAVEAAQAGDTVVVLKDLDQEAQVNITGSIILDLNGKTLSNTTQNIWDENNGKWSLISVQGEGVEVTITGNGILKAKEDDEYAIDLRDGAKVIIENGTYIGNISAVYVLEGELTINGGTFRIQQLASDKPYAFTINCYDANYKNGTCKISIKGGIFNNFDPAANAAESSDNSTNFLAEGYKSTKNGDNYTVTIQEYTITYELSGGALSGDDINPEAYTIESDAITLNNPIRTGYTFTGWSGTDIEGTSNPVTIAKGSTGDRSYEANWEINQYTITFDTDGGSAIATITGDYGQIVPSVANPTKECNSFAGWDKELPTTMPAENITLKATWNYTCSRSSGGGGSSRSSSNNTMNEVVLGGEVEVATGDNVEVNTVDENNDNNGNGNAEAYDSELLDAYEWAYKNGITTMDTIEKARLKDGITRAELAKMMVVFMSEVLHMQPVITETFDYSDVNEKALGDLTGYIQLAYQYQIMGINADGKALQNFNPRGKVSRAEFATVLSRVLYGSINNQQGANYREKHIEALNKAGILTDTNPETQELRGWIILMLYRSQNSETNNEEESTAQVTTGDVAEVESGSAVEVATGTTAEIATGAVVEANTGSVAQTAIAETNTGDVAKVESGSTAEVATGDSK